MEEAGERRNLNSMVQEYTQNSFSLVATALFVSGAYQIVAR